MDANGPTEDASESTSMSNCRPWRGASRLSRREPKCNAKACMPRHAQNRHTALNRFGGDGHQLTALLRQSRAWRQHQCLCGLPKRLLPASFTNNIHFHLTQPLEIVREVPCEGIVVVKQGDAHAVVALKSSANLPQHVLTRQHLLSRPTRGSLQPSCRSRRVGFVSGQIPLDPSSGNLNSNDMHAATTQCIRNAEAILKAANPTLNNVVKVSVFLTTMDDYADMDDAYRKAMPEPFPAREAVAVKALPKGAKVEISMIASKH